MKKYSASYRQEIITAARQLQPEGSSCLLFKNLGTSTVYIDGIIPLEQGESQAYNEKPYVKIESDFSIRFADTTDNRLLVVKTIYNEL